MTEQQRVRFNFRLDLACGALGATFFAGSFMPVLVRRMGGSELEVALILASGPIGHIIAPLPGYIYNRFPPAKVLASVGIAARVVFVIGLLLATSAISLSLAWVAFNIVALSSIASSTVLVQRIYPDEQRGQAMARVRMFANLVGMGSVIAGGALLEIADVRSVLGASALISFAAPLFLMFMRYEIDRDRRPMPSPIRLGSVALQDTAFRRYLVATTFIGFGNAMGGTAYPIMLVDKFDAPTVLVGVIAAVQSAATIAGYHFWGRRIDRGSTVALLRGNALLMLLLPLTYLLAPSAPYLLIGAVVAGVTNAMADLAFFTSMIELAGNRAGFYMAAQSFVLGVRATLAPFVASALLITVGAPVTLIAVIVCIACGAFLVRGIRPAARTEALRVPAEAFAD